jgi:LysM repeat protein
MIKMRTFILIFPLLFLLIPTLGKTSSSATAPAEDRSVDKTVVLAAATATCTSPYTVQAGDTLTSIAQKCSVDYSTLLTANGNITNPNLIFPGQAVNIPQGGSIPNTGGQTYTVVAGDRLFRIALRYNTTVQAILNVNPWITNPNLIHPGDVITLPTGSGPGIPNTGGQTYTVVSGDTLSGIAQRYNTTTAALQSANTWITNPDRIYPGWVIVIP